MNIQGVNGKALVRTSAEERFDELAMQDEGRSQKSWQTLTEKLGQRQIRFGGELLPTSLKPHFIPKTVHDEWVRQTEQFTQLLEKVGSSLAKSTDGLRSLGFCPKALELFEVDAGLNRSTFNARPDGLWIGDQLQFVEFNSDSPAMMTYSDRIQDLQRSLFPLSELGDEFGIEYTDRTQCFFDGVIDAYRQVGGDKEDPTIAVVDWAGQMTCNELIHTAEIFEELGCPAFVCDPRELSIRQGKLFGKGREIDIVQRRVLFPECIDRADELTALLTAYRERHAVLVNPLRSYLIGSKGILALLQERGGILSDEEVDCAKKLIPNTKFLDDAFRRELREVDRKMWVLKPAFGHGGYSVVLGSSVTQLDWEIALEKTKGGTWVAQERIHIPRYTLPICDGDGVEWRELFINWTPWIFAGRFGGGTSRCSMSPTVSITQRGALLPAIAAH